jgi:NADH-quinone oxidoreductase subunit H
MSTSQIVAAQDDLWFGLILLPSFAIYTISMVGETTGRRSTFPRGGEPGRRLPHRVLLEVRPALPGRVHQHGHRRRARHQLFLGGWHAPWGIVNIWPGSNDGYWPPLCSSARCCSSSSCSSGSAARPAIALRPVHGVRLKRLIPVSLV